MAQDIHVKYVVDDSQIVAAQRRLGLLDDEWKDVRADVDKAGAAARKAGDEMAEAGKKGHRGAKEAADGTSLLGKSLGNVGGLIAGAFAVDRILAFGGAVVSATSEYQKFKAVLTTALGSETAASAALAQITDFAAKTPFAVNEITEAYVKLANQGFQPTRAQLTSLGDLAASTGKSFDQLAEAVIDAQTGEFERLKEFGILARKNGDQVAFTFKGVTTTIKASNEAIRAYVVGLGQTEGVLGSMAGIAEVLPGQISNLGDAFGQFFTTLGNRSSSTFGALVATATEAVQAITRAVESESAAFERLASTAAGAALDDYASLKTAPEIAKGLEELTGKIEAARKESDALFRAGSEARRVLDGFFSTSADRENYEALIAQQSDAEAKARGLADAYKVLSDRLKKAQDQAAVPPVEMGYIKQLQDERKALNDLINTQYTKAQLEGADGRRTLIRIAVIDEEIARLTKLEKTRLDAVKALSPVNPLDSLLPTKKELKDAEKDYQDSRDEMMRITEKEIDAQAAVKEESIRSQLEATRDFEGKIKILREAGVAYLPALAKMELAYQQDKWEKAKVLASDAAAFFLSTQQQQLGQELSNVQQQRALELQLAGDSKSAQARINNTYAAQEREIRRKQSENEKLQAVFSITVNTVAAAMRAYKDLGPVAGTIAALGISALGAAQLAVVLSRKVPAYAKGTRYVNGPGSETSDSVPALLSRGERVVTADRNRAYTPALDAIHDGRIAAPVLNQLVADYLTHGAPAAHIAVPMGGGGGLPSPDAYGRAVAEALRGELNVTIVDDANGRRVRRGRQGAWQQFVSARGW